MLEKQLAEIRPRREEIKKRMRELRESTDKELMETYVLCRKDGVPLPVFVEAQSSGNGYACRCGMTFSPSGASKLKNDGFCRCETCRRIVYIK